MFRVVVRLIILIWKFFLVPKEQWAKLNSKSVECIYFGYGDDKFRYILWDPKNRKLIQNRDVVFKEDQTFEDFENEEEVSQEYTRGSFEEKDESPTLVREEKARVDPSLSPPSDAEKDVDEFFDDVVNDDQQDEEDPDQAVPRNLRKLARVPVLSTKYQHQSLWNLLKVVN